MLASFLLSLREGIEAALIIGIVLGALRKMNRTELAPSAWAGTLSAVVASILVAILLSLLGFSLEGPAEQIFEGVTMLVAAGLLTWMIFWMQRQSRTLKPEIEANVQRAAGSTGRRAMFLVAFVAVLREGIELALFLTASVFATNATQTTLGALVGLAAAALLGWGIFAATIRLDLRRFFQVTGILLILFAAGLVAHGVHEFNEAGLIPSVIEHVWDINPVLNEDSTVGSLLKALFGYNGNPSLTEVIAYAVYFAAVWLSLRPAGPPRALTALQA